MQEQEGDKQMGNLGATEIILIVLVILVFFGAKKIPELAKGLGQGIREFKKATKDASDAVNDEVKKIDDTVKKS